MRTVRSSDRISGGLLPGGVCSRGASAPGGCLLPGGVCLLPRGMYLLQGVLMSALGGVCSQGN